MNEWINISGTIQGLFPAPIKDTGFTTIGEISVVFGGKDSTGTQMIPRAFAFQKMATPELQCCR